MSGESSELRALRDAVRDALARHSRPRDAMESPQGYDDKLWALLCEQIGVSALAVPESYGGLGASWAEVCAVQHELGRSLTPSPFLSSVVATQALLASGDEDACARLLPGIADGSRLAALAWAGESGDWTRAACSARGSVVDGHADYVLDGDLADVLLVCAGDEDGTAVYEVDVAAARREHTPALDPTRRLATVVVDAAPGRRLGPVDLAELGDLAVVALAAEQTGGAERALELTVDYVGQRRQFGRPIGSFQAIKHRLADAYVLLESARSAVHAAVRAVVEGSDELPLDAEAARLTCSEAFSHLAAEMIQLHGGIAITWEHDAQLYFKRAHGSGRLFGAPVTLS